MQRRDVVRGQVSSSRPRLPRLESVELPSRERIKAVIKGVLAARPPLKKRVRHSVSSSRSTAPSPDPHWEFVISRVFEAEEKSPKETAYLIHPVVEPGNPEPLGTLLNTLEGRDPKDLYQKYLDLGGPEPRRADPLAVLKAFVDLFEMWTEVPAGDADPV